MVAIGRRPRLKVAEVCWRSGGGLDWRCPRGGVAALRNPAEGNPDLRLVDGLGIVVAEPILDLVVLGMAGVGGDVELVVEPGYAAAILGRSVAFARDVARVPGAGLSLARVGQDQLVLSIRAVSGARVAVQALTQSASVETPSSTPSRA
jgi:hypothetical protein